MVKIKKKFALKFSTVRLFIYVAADTDTFKYVFRIQMNVTN